MDIVTVTGFRAARTRADLALMPGEAYIAGGTWLMSEPQPDTTGFVDLTTMDWPSIDVTLEGLRIGATCTIADLVAWAAGDAVPADWAATAMIPDAANALLAECDLVLAFGTRLQDFTTGSGKLVHDDDARLVSVNVARHDAIKRGGTVSSPEEPLSTNLGKYRILRTSPLTEVPFICCSD